MGAKRLLKAVYFPLFWRANIQTETVKTIKVSKVFYIIHLKALFLSKNAPMQAVSDYQKAFLTYLRITIFFKRA